MRSRALRSLAGVLVLAVLTAAPGRAAKENSTWGIPNASFPLPGVMAAGQPTGTQIQLIFPAAGKTPAPGSDTFTVIGYFKSGMSEYD